MKLLRLDAKGLRPEKADVDIDLTIHPQITVVLGATGPVRDTLIEAIAGIPKGVAATGGVIEVGGVPERLSEESLARLGLRTDLNVVVRAADLPGHEDMVLGQHPADLRAAGVACDRARDAVARDEAEVDAKRSAHEEAVAALTELQEGGGQAAAVAEALGAEREGAAAELHAATIDLSELEADVERRQSELDTATTARLAAEQAVTDAAQREQSRVSPPQASDLESRSSELQRRIALLAAQDPAAVRTNLERVERAHNVERAPIPAALAFADAWRDLHQQLAALDRSETKQEREARTKLDAAKRAAVEAERDLRVSALAPESVADLEAAHNAVLEAQEKSNSRFSGTRARIRLDQLRAVERNALEQLGFNTYADYMMSSSSRGVGAGKRAVLQTARIRVAEAEAEWQALGGDVSRDVWRADLLEQRSAIAPRIALLLGHEPEGPGVEQELRDLRAVPPAGPAAIGALRSALSSVGLEVQDEDLGQDELVRLATAWLEENAHLDERRAGLAAELRGIEKELAEAPSPGATPATRDRPGPSAEQAQRDLGEADRRTSGSETALADTVAKRDAARRRETAARDRLRALEARDEGAEGALRSLVGSAGQRAESAATELSAAERGLEHSRADLVTAEERLSTLDEAEQTPQANGDAPSDDREELIEEIEWYLLARLAAQRAVGEAGSVPLVLDDTFRDLEVAEAVRVMESVERMSGAVQVIAVSDDRALSFWAEALGKERAGVVSLGD